MECYWNNENLFGEEILEKIPVYYKKRMVLWVTISRSGSPYVCFLSVKICSFIGLKRGFESFLTSYCEKNAEIMLIATCLIEADRLGLLLFRKLGFEISVRERKCVCLNNCLHNRLVLSYKIKKLGDNE